jgi:hypothetical protein
MDTFDKLIDQLLNEFSVEDRNDPAFYDYAVILIQQLKQRNLIPPGVEVRKTAMQIVKDGYYNYIDAEDNVSYKVTFIFDTSVKDISPNNLRIEIENLLDDEEPKVIENTHEEKSINEIVDFLNKASREAEKESGKIPGEDMPEELSDTGSELPGVQQSSKPTSPVQAPAEPQGAPGFSTGQQAPNTSQYLKGLR